MKKVILIYIMMSVLHLFAAGFNPLSPQIHTLFDKSVYDPILLYYFHETGITFDDFDNDIQIVEKDLGGTKCSFQLLPDDGLKYIDIKVVNSAKAEKQLNELLQFYKLPFDFAEFNANAYLMKIDNEELDFSSEDFDWKDYGENISAEAEEQPVWNLETLKLDTYEDSDNFEYDYYNEESQHKEPEHIRLITYKSPDSYYNDVTVTYAMNEAGKELIYSIFIEGFFYETPEDSWSKPADKYYSKLPKSEIKHIESVISKMKEKQEEQEQAYEKIAEQNRLEEEKAAEQLKIEMQNLVTIWDDYLRDLSNTAKLMYLLNLKGFSGDDVANLEKKYEFQNNYYDWYQPADKKVGIFITKDNDYKYRVNGICFRFDENQDIPFLGINQSIAWSDLIARFGYSYRKNSWDPALVVLASTNDPEGRNLDLSIEFKFNADSKISEIWITKTEFDKFNYKGKLHFIKSGPVTRECINGRGIFQYANGFWVDGFFRDGKLTGGTPQELNFVDQDIAGIRLLTDGNKPYKSGDTSFWKDYFQGSDYKSILTIFNKKDYKPDDWDTLKEYYFYSGDSNYLYSPDGYYQIETSYDKTYVRSLQVMMITDDDVASFGLEKQRSYDELSEAFGYDYVENKELYKAILMPEGDFNKDNHLDLDVKMNSDYSKIEYLKFTPRKPDKIVINNLLTFIPAGANPRPGIDYQWVDGYWFQGQLRGGIPWKGGVYFYISNTPFDSISEGKIAYGVEPTILTKPRKPRDPVYDCYEEYTGSMNEFDNSRGMLFMYVDDMIEDKERTKYDKNWEMLDYYAQKANSNLNNAFNPLYSLICQLEGKEGAYSALVSARTILTNIRNLEKVVQACRNVGLRYGDGAQEDLDELNNLNTYIGNIQSAHETLVQELVKLGYL
ncbi:MAG: hypothetical protein JXR56_01920 [Candidatus Cloacimonetes bacterium]|nr:hypothetical protein [Candidatus Cloacimonadota bacterium]